MKQKRRARLCRALSRASLMTGKKKPEIASLSSKNFQNDGEAGDSLKFSFCYERVVECLTLAGRDH